MGNLNTGQQAAADGFFSFLFNDEKELIISGGGGTGKTFLMGHLIDQIIPQYHNTCQLMGIAPQYFSVVMTATTNKAAEVLAEATDRPTTTIHSFLNLRVKENYSTGKTELQRTAKWKVHENTVVFIDECLHPSMEIMTDSGFKRIDSLNQTELIAQFCQNTQEISYVKPLRYIQKNYVGEMVDVISENVLDISITENHDCLIYKKDSYQKVKAKDVCGVLKLPVAGKGTGAETSLSLEEKFCIAYQADGSVIRPYNLNHKAVKSVQARFGFTPIVDCGSTSFDFTKERKIIQFLADFSSLLITEHNSLSKKRKVFHVKNVPLNSVSKNLRDIFNITTFSQKKAQEFIQYISLWDGWKQGVGGIGYGSTNYDNACFVQEVAILAGYRAVLSKIIDSRSAKFNDYYKISIKTSSSFVDGQVWNRSKKTSFYSGNVYCVTVPKGNIIVRREGKVCITGNCSMIDSALRKSVLEGTHKCKIIYVGDHYQLPPVFEKISPIYKDSLLNHELTEPMRNAAQPALAALCNQIRETVRTGIFNPIKAVPGIIDWLHEDELLNEVDNHFIKSNIDARILAYSNATVNSLNNYIREAKGLPEQYTAGEQLISNSAIQLGGTQLSIEEPVEVMKADPQQETIHLSNDAYFLVQRMDLHTKLGGYMHNVAVPVNRIHFEQLIKYYAKQKDWVTYFNLKNNYPDLRPRDACTVHKSQGSTYNTVFIDLDSLSTCNQPDVAARLLYVAVTRPSNRIIMYGKLASKYGGIIE